MIEEFNILNFKNFADKQEIPLKPITLIYGANSSGKSSVLQSLLLLKQTIEDSTKSNVALFPMGSHVDLGNYKEFIHKHDTKNVLSFKFSINIPDPKVLPEAAGFKLIKESKFGIEFEFKTNPNIIVKQINIFNGNELIFSLTPKKEEIIDTKKTLPLFWFGPDILFCVSKFNWDALFWKDCLKLTKDALTTIVKKDNIQELMSKLDKIINEIKTLEEEKKEEIEDLEKFEEEQEELQEKIDNIEECIANNIDEISDEEISNLKMELLNDQGKLADIENEISILKENLYRINSLKISKSNLDEKITYYSELLKITTSEGYDQLKKKYEELYKSFYFSLDNYLPSLKKFVPMAFKKKFMFHPYEFIDKYKFVNLFWLIQYLSDEVNQFLKKILYIGPLREKPVRTYINDGNSYKNVGTSGEMVPNILYKNSELVEKLNEFFNKMGFGYKLVIESTLNDAFAVRLVDLSSGLSAGILDVGFGISQILPVLVQSILSEESVLLIEQPEIHLHPKLQGELGEFIAENVKNTKNRFIIETHSENIILRIQKLIRQKKFSNNDISVIYVEKLNDKSICHNLRIDEKGKFLDEWPDGFFEEGFEEIFG